MSTINNTDLFLISSGGVNYKVTAADVAAYAGAGATFGLGLNLTGGIVKVSLPVASTPPAVGALAAEAINGSLYWDDNLGQLFIRYANTGGAGGPVWVAAAPPGGGGGGAGTVTSVSGTAPIAVATGTTTPVISLNQGLGVGVNGVNIAVSIPQVGTPPAINTTATGAFNGSLYWDDNLTQLFIRYSNGGSPVWVAAAPAASGGGTTYTATLPLSITGTVVSLNLGLGVALNGNFLIAKTPEASTPPAIGTGAAQAQLGSTYYDDTLGAMFIYYSNGGTPAWVQV